MSELLSLSRETVMSNRFHSSINDISHAFLRLIFFFQAEDGIRDLGGRRIIDRKSTRLNSSHDQISYAVFCLKKKNKRNSYDLSSCSVLCLEEKAMEESVPQPGAATRPSQPHATTVMWHWIASDALA